MMPSIVLGPPFVSTQYFDRYLALPTSSLSGARPFCHLQSEEKFFVLGTLRGSPPPRPEANMANWTTFWHHCSIQDDLAKSHWRKGDSPGGERSIVFHQQNQTSGDGGRKYEQGRGHCRRLTHVDHRYGEEDQHCQNKYHDPLRRGDLGLA